jgi:hypothetical protein
VNVECVRIWKVVVVAQFKLLPSICLEGMRKSTNDLSQDRSPDRALNPAPPE